MRGAEILSRQTSPAVRWSLLIVAALTPVGCGTWHRPATLPHKLRWEQGSLLVHSNFRIPRRHRLLEEIVALREVLSQRLGIPPSDETIDVYLFDDVQAFRRIVRERFPELADRRALFLKSDTQLQIIGQWGDQLAEDLRHEATHAYLHSVIRHVPLWLDEGLAEFFEIEGSLDGFHERHIRWLVNQYQQRNWTPHLHRLELIHRPHDLSQTDYAEAWLWVHFLLHDSAETALVLRQSLDTLRTTGDSRGLVTGILERVPDAGGRVLDHLHNLAVTVDSTPVP